MSIKTIFGINIRIFGHILYMKYIKLLMKWKAQSYLAKTN